MGFLKNLKEGLFKSSSNISEGVSNIFLKSKPNEKILEEIEDFMIQCDFGIDVASKFKLIFANKKFSEAELNFKKAITIKPDFYQAYNNLGLLMSKIKKLGDDVTETAAVADRQKVHQYKDFEMTEDVSTGRIEIQRYKQSDEATYYGQPLTEETYMGYSPGETIIGKNGKPIKIPDTLFQNYKPYFCDTIKS